MRPAFAIEAEGVELGIAIRENGIFRFYAAHNRLFGLQKFSFVTLHDVERAARRVYADQVTKPAGRRGAELPRRVALALWRGTYSGLRRVDRRS
jgi:hypothetical protein